MNSGLIVGHRRPVAAVTDPAMVSGRYYRTPNGALSTASVANGVLRVTPFFVPRSTLIDRIGLEVTVIGDVGSKLRLGIYADDGKFRPGGIVLDAGQVAGDAVAVAENPVSQQLPRGWHWFGCAAQSVTSVGPTVRVLGVQGVFPGPGADYLTSQPGASGSLGYQMTGVTGALPAVFVVGNISSTAPALFVRAA